MAHSTQGAANMTESQQYQAEQLWRAFKENNAARQAEFDRIHADLNSADMGRPLPLHDSHKTTMLLNISAELVACLTLQQEARVHLMRTFVLSIMTPFQV